MKHIHRENKRISGEWCYMTNCGLSLEKTEMTDVPEGSDCPECIFEALKEMKDRFFKLSLRLDHFTRTKGAQDGTHARKLSV